MAENSGELSISGAPSPELTREFRVLQQRLSMHSTLRDRYVRRALALSLVLLGASVIFVATTFASDQTLTLPGLTGGQARTLLRIASITAFFGSLVDLRVDWKGKAARHRQAIRDLSDLLGRFRAARRPGDTWDPAATDELLRRYWEVVNTIVEVPEREFVKLKSRHLRKVELSKLVDRTPGAPLWLLSLRLYAGSIRGALRGPRRDPR